MRERTASLPSAQRLSKLAKDDFFNRHTQAVPRDEIKELIHACRQKMAPLIRRFLKPNDVFDPTNNDDVKRLIDQMNVALSRSKKENARYKATEKQIQILEDLYEINQLAVISIPGEDGEPTNYCSLTESMGGGHSSYFSR